MTEFIHREYEQAEDVSDIIAKLQVLHDEIVTFDMENREKLEVMADANTLDIIFPLVTMINSAKQHYHLTREQCESLLDVAQTEFEKLKEKVK